MVLERAQKDCQESILCGDVKKGPAHVKGTDVLLVWREGQSQPEIPVAMMVEIGQPREVRWA